MITLGSYFKQVVNPGACGFGSLACILEDASYFWLVFTVRAILKLLQLG